MILCVSWSDRLERV